MKKSILAAATVLAASSNAFAIEDTWYARASYGVTDLDTDRAERELCSIDLCYEFDDGKGFSLNIGYRLNRYVAFETGYTDLGDTSDSDSVDLIFVSPIDAPSFSRVDVKAKLSSNTKTMAALFSTDAGKSLSAGARLGYHFWESEVKTTGTSGAFSSSVDEDGTDIFYGVFANWRTGRWTLGLEHTLFESEGNDPTLSALSLSLDF
ncbi:MULTISPECIES: outer membrane beta-barrel protein [unclassified Microbulbifer]|uniref:porin family protein n=1 Tax=unclassified Microbulbifer TaxID=2619833 RepID=UPI0027E50340|nr:MULTISPECIES: outer membrane beta-barrel protein [unclassified Microbulbifer]